MLLGDYAFAALRAPKSFRRDENSADRDVEIFRALRPRLSSIPTAMLLNESLQEIRRALHGVLATLRQGRRARSSPAP